MGECARSVLNKPPKRGPLHEVLMASEEPASKRSAPDKLPERGQLKGERTKGLSEFEKKEIPLGAHIRGPTYYET